MHPIHERYVTVPAGSENSLDSFLTLLDSLDELERDRICRQTFLYFDFANYFFPDEPTWEDASKRRFREFAEKCRSIVAAGMHEWFLVCGIVTYTLATLYSRCNCDVAFERARLRERLGQPFLDDELFGNAESQRRSTEEMLNNLVGDLAMSEHLYEAFCERVVAKLLRNSPPPM